MRILDRYIVREVFRHALLGLAVFTFVFFALEAAIMSLALELYLKVPLSVAYVISALVIIPVVTFGITFINRLRYVFLTLIYRAA